PRTLLPPHSSSLVRSVLLAQPAAPEISPLSLHDALPISSAVLELPRSLFYETLSQQSGFQIGDDGDLMALLTQLAQVKAKYDKVDRKSTRLNSSHVSISYAVFCLKKKRKKQTAPCEGTTT